jgi:DNA-binding transcriptional LysR family regulator
VLRSKNLNLLPILEALLEEQSVVKAAARVHLSQPAVSGALARLRVEFDDQLLVRVGRKMQRTDRASRILPDVKRACADLERLFDVGVFDPATSGTRFVVAAPDHLAFLISRQLLPILAVGAPGVLLQFVDPPSDLSPHIMEGAIDLAVAANFGIWEDLRYEPLIFERLVATMSRHHPLAARTTIDFHELELYPALARTSRSASPVDNTPLATGVPVLDAPAQITLEQFTDAVLLTLESDAVVTAPQMLIDHLARFLPVVGVPFSDDYGIGAGMFWAPFQDESPEIHWLRSIVRKCFPAEEGQTKLESGSIPQGNDSGRRSRAQHEDSP